MKGLNPGFSPVSSSRPPVLSLAVFLKWNHEKKNLFEISKYLRKKRKYLSKKFVYNFQKHVNSTNYIQD